jgi:hypothetical protein
MGRPYMADMNGAVDYISWLMDDTSNKKLKLLVDDFGHIRFRLPPPLNKEEYADAAVSKITQKHGKHARATNHPTGFTYVWDLKYKRQIILHWNNLAGVCIALLDGKAARVGKYRKDFK